MTLDKSMILLDGLCNTLKKLRGEGFNSEIEDSVKIAESVGIQASFPNKRNRKAKKMDLDESEDDGFHKTLKQKFDLQINQVLDTLLTQIKWRFAETKQVIYNFSFLHGDALKEKSVADLKKDAEALAHRYDQDLDEFVIQCGIESFKHQAPKLTSDFFSCSPLDVLQLLFDFNLTESYPNLCIALRLFLTLPVTVASDERSFSKLKLIKTYLRSTMGQIRLTSLAKLSIEIEITKFLKYDDLRDEFASVDARR
ncbi:uncharacterized protein LOC117181222 [Belonocnema kinseyi]|uniref:uncharacterized protein LOC117181222 n=1 Tax=Belonocnema kinseyi TaxID=2817044 RepID=UPI00143D78E6|nr:uncharacterized protein LOC117181222 [Belonocnema kinseyi]